ncbi:lipoprotein-releasing system transmembrane subunit LolC [Pseudomonas sp. Choline-3u-10]|jgi:lipoprotein-releasing system permease protein|uniref:lipoprotein-releasing ABC transporter permease subunit n=1 Tax=Pseudomonadaceae TaxID=135621 RepID=UPI00061800C2|nr:MULTISPECIES: lipoprotein-releasing ABC transporter permease subunit [Pseudomonadaceae]MAL37309.1 lipoprotein-releasing system transmembrane subunit LolC [Pseudomonas sp.]MBU0948895.1 lipoprotein-releasing ABC transporter permease subunit [Gammaproteobacteria bacterium]KJJ64196.1 cell division protein FtsX [Pseudomonas sp. 10B238]MBK3796690.1 lipoprotein-releasing ABC transporter permease subunit [Stutzerimonas stutzeri]MBK3877193.1 lipoprotein-releasing ABC transporter permease subunit [St|tara:strand:+ start:3843 stop:5090 length:1248 start_codon:yes stop_codon:yes gene_type:complete
MFRPLSVYIGARYTRARRRSLFVSFISFTSMIGLALGVLVMIVVLSVMNGFDYEMRSRVLGMVPHATIESSIPIDDWPTLAERLAQHPQVAAVAPFIQMQGLLTHRGQVTKILINAVDPVIEPEVSIVGQFFREGTLADLAPGEFGIVIGDKAANTLGVGVGDKVTFVAPEVTVTPAGVFPRMKRFTVRGIFHVGAGEIDGYVAMANISDLARLHRWQPDQVQGVRLRFVDLFQAPRIAWELAGQLGDDFYSRDWTRTHGNLYQAIRMEKAMIGLLLLLIVAVAAFNIISTLVMVVTDKRGDIAILRTLGATPRQIMAIFMVQGTVIGVVGTLVGALLGIFAALNVSSWVAALERLIGHKFLSADVYFIDYLPSRLMTADVVQVCVAALILSFFATLYPAWRAARTQPAEALRYE